MKETKLNLHEVFWAFWGGNYDDCSFWTLFSLYGSIWAQMQKSVWSPDIVLSEDEIYITYRAFHQGGVVMLTLIWHETCLGGVRACFCPASPPHAPLPPLSPSLYSLLSSSLSCLHKLCRNWHKTGGVLSEDDFKCFSACLSWWWSVIGWFFAGVRIITRSWVFSVGPVRNASVTSVLCGEEW